MIIEDNGSLNMADTLLVVDDVELNRAILAEIFQDSYQIEEAENGRAALEKLISGRERFCGVLLDVMMPEMDGISLLKILQGSHMTEEIPVFLITSETSPALWKEAYSLGIMDLIPKPVIPYIVRYRVDSVVRLFQAKRRLGSQVERQKDELLKKAEEMYRLSIGMAESLANVIEFKSDESSSHIRRIHEITMALLQDTRLGNGLSRRDIEQIGLAAIMHDVGKIAIPDHILNKPGRFTPDEFELMKTHTVEGGQLLSKIWQIQGNDSYYYAHDIALHHHERWDGNGYPDGLKAAGIQIEEALERFMDSEAMFERFLGKFLEDETYRQLKEALEKGDIETSIMKSHTLKGVTGNLSMKPLYQLTSRQVELLRAGQLEEARELMADIDRAYEETDGALKE